MLCVVELLGTGGAAIASAYSCLFALLVLCLGSLTTYIIHFSIENDYSRKRIYVFAELSRVDHLASEMGMVTATATPKSCLTRS